MRFDDGHGRLLLLLRGAASAALARLASPRLGKAAGILVACLFLTASVVAPSGPGSVAANASADQTGDPAALAKAAEGLDSPDATSSGLPARESSSGELASGALATGGVELVGDESADRRGSRGLFYYAYKVVKGDTLSAIAEEYNVTLDTVVSFNDIKNARALQPDTILKIPSMAGILYTAKAGDTASSIAAANKISADRIVEANGLDSEAVRTGARLFLPDARLASFSLREISGDLFRWPVKSYITSWYGWRNDPFTGVRKFHNGIDIGVPLGTSVRAAMDGTVAATGYSSSLGNYVLLRHHAGWQSLYGHLKTIAVKKGQRVALGERIAYSGNTGYSTGPHLHFTVIKNGRTVNPYNVLH